MSSWGASEMSSPSRLRMARTATGVLATALALTVSATVAPALHAQATMAPKTDGTLLLAVGESRVINHASSCSPNGAVTPS